MMHHGWELYRLGWILYDLFGVFRGRMWLLIPLLLGIYGFYLRYGRRRHRGD